MYILDVIEPITESSGLLYLLHKDNIYEFSIDSKNNLELLEIFKNEYYDFVITEPDTRNTFELLSKSKTLRSKIIKTYIDNKIIDSSITDEEEEIDPDEWTEEMKHVDKKLEYFPEDLEYVDDYDVSEDDGSYFRIMDNLNLKHLIEISDEFLINDDPLLSPYDSYIYSNNELGFVSKLNNMPSTYRILIHDNGKVILKTTGEISKHYTLSIVDDKILLSKNK